MGCRHPATALAGAALAALLTLWPAAPAPAAAPVLEVPDPVDAAATAQVAAVTDALERFWAAELGAAWSAPRGDYLLVDTDDEPGAQQMMCASSADALRGNAFYCPGQDGIVIDASALLPVLRYSYGGGAVTASLAHEFGHLVQARLGPTPEQRRSDPKRYPNLLLEQQADCMAGAFLAATGAGATSLPLQQFADGTAMQTLGPLLDFHDDAAALPAAATSLTEFSPGAVSTVAATSAAGLATVPYGQFAKATTSALATGAERNRTSAGCFAGAWAAHAIASAADGGLGSWPGDPDEAIAAVQHWPGATMADLAGFVTGFDGALASCG